MRKVFALTAATVFLFGLVWQCGRFLLRWSGHYLGLRDLPSSYGSFIDNLGAKIAGEISISWMMGSWLLMSIGLLALLVLYSGTTEPRVHSERRTFRF